MLLALAYSMPLAFSVIPSLSLNPCNDAPIALALVNLPCEDGKVQSGANVTIGAVGLMAADLDPIPLPLKDSGACAVNVHWHLGAEHLNVGTYDQDGDAWMAANAPATAAHRQLAEEGTTDVGHFCPGYNATDTKYTTEYAWEYCTGMHVGYTYEFHWPHSNLGQCNTEWQFQSPFMDGVLCAATVGGMSPQAGVDSIFTAQTTKIGVMAQVFTIVNDAQYDYPTWDSLDGWNFDLATDIAIYQVQAHPNATHPPSASC